ILLGLVGLPVFSGGKGGFNVLAGATGGYIIGYLVAVILISWLKGSKNKVIRSMISVFAGIPIIYAVGVPWMKVLLGLTWPAAFTAGLLPFIPGDVIKCVAAVYICKPLYRVVNAADYSVGKPAA
ncbi:MAG: biotin transporter BioY, partial [Lachnospiraceae bacterium]|nr:biotin transporter BioY [Lachnospiraceae bacterium]